MAADNLVGNLARRATLRQLQLFEAVARLGSFTHAAEELRLAQPTVSMQLRKLSETVGAPLFEQTGKEARLTEAGREVDAACEEVFGALATLETKVADLKGLRTGRLRLAAISSATDIGPHLLGRFGQLYPGIEFALTVTNREALLSRIEQQRDDLFILGRPPPELNIEGLPLVPNPLVAVAHRDHPLVGTPRIPLARLLKEPFIMRESGSGTRSALLQLIEQKGLSAPPVRMEISSIEAVKHATAAGLGVAVMSLHALTLEGTDGRISVLDVQGFPIMKHWFLAYPKNRRLTAIAQAFVDFVGKEAYKISEEFRREIVSIRSQRKVKRADIPK